MTAHYLLSEAMPTIKTSDTGDDVLNLMQIYHVRHLPIVNQDQLLGVVSEEDILIQDPSEAIGSYRLSFLHPFVYENDHVFEVLNKIGKYQLSLIPVVDEKETFKGSITLEDVTRYFATQYGFAHPGSIIILETQKHDYSLSEIARIAESEDVQILASFIHQDLEANRATITLKVNTQDLGGVRATYERFGYQIMGTFSEIEHYDGLKDRYDSFMSYLNV